MFNIPMEVVTKCTEVLSETTFVKDPESIQKYGSELLNFINETYGNKAQQKEVIASLYFVANFLTEDLISKGVANAPDDIRDKVEKELAILNLGMCKSEDH